MNKKIELKDKMYIFANAGSAQEFIGELVCVLEKEFDEFSTDAMSDYALFLRGQKDMLGQIVSILKKEIK